ncbi:hypothetical protein [Streptomyces californicus]|uniref:hypothetical protein n=1 Tax=Streptomyces californicus TaxID=67351 RepID=UPI003715DCB7
MDEISPPKYEWSARTAQEAETSLEAARHLIDAHLKTLAPGDAFIKGATRRMSPIVLRISLDLGPMVEVINESRHLKEQSDPGDTDSTDSRPAEGPQA